MNFHLAMDQRIDQHNNVVRFRQDNCKQNILQQSNNVILGKEANNYVKATTVEKWNNGTYDLWEVGFTLCDATEEKYNNIVSIEVSLYKNNKRIANRITVNGGVEELKKDDIFYDGMNGQITCSFKERDSEDVTRYWKSSVFKFSTPTKAEIKISTLDKNSGNIVHYIVENTNVKIDKPKLFCIKNYRECI